MRICQGFPGCSPFSTKADICSRAALLCRYVWTIQPREFKLQGVYSLTPSPKIIRLWRFPRGVTELPGPANRKTHDKSLLIALSSNKNPHGCLLEACDIISNRKSFPSGAHPGRIVGCDKRYLNGGKSTGHAATRYPRKRRKKIPSRTFLACGKPWASRDPSADWGIPIRVEGMMHGPAIIMKKVVGRQVLCLKLTCSDGRFRSVSRSDVCRIG